MLDQISDGVYFVNQDRRITYWNHGAERITGYGAEDVLRHSCSEGILSHVNDAGQQLCLNGCPLAAVMKDGRRARPMRTSSTLGALYIDADHFNDVNDTFGHKSRR